jgi:hypothetical protein
VREGAYGERQQGRGIGRSAGAKAVFDPAEH